MRFKLIIAGWIIAISSILSLGLNAEECLCQENCYCECENNCNCDYDDTCYDSACCGLCEDFCFSCCCRGGRPNNCNPCSQRAYDRGLRGLWMPPDPPLFRPFAADIRQLTYSVQWRFNDNALTKNSIAVSFYDRFPFYRWLNVWPWGGMLQIELDGGLWAVFDPGTFSAPLINADYYVGVPITYAWCNWSFRLRGYHISSHIGDEYLLNHPEFDRRNPSIEALDFYVSNQFTRELRLYGGIGYIVDQDESFHVDPCYVQCGLELRMYSLGFHSYLKDIFGHPFYAMQFGYRGDYDKHINSTYVLGYEFGKCCGPQKRLRAFIMYHDGYSADGQFCKDPTNYFSVGLSYGY